MSGQHHAPAALIPRNPLVQYKLNRRLDSRAGLDNLQKRRSLGDVGIRTPDPRLEVVTEVTMNIPVSFTCQKAVNRSSWSVGTDQTAAALPGQSLRGDRRINGTLSEQRAEGITGL